ncbi:tigger transposable element-derived protein 6-like [Ischnura elegans]|uniref:tigger transposable element-derived protein 6-like n=1 Tax=Ischnura elegans TaxID=197161 RepID=UPI001ED87BC1|nr:tigger transposable element-derived protein 6-like [Ischnura elegans]
MANTTKKRRQLSIETKLQILESVDTGEKETAIAERFNIPASTLSTGPERKRSRSCKNDELDRKVFEWFTEVRSANIPLSGSILQDRAKTIALKLGIDDFHSSNGWLSRFKRRWNLTTLRVCGEEAAVDVAVVEEWKKNLPSLVAGYDPKDIFNADESGFFYNLLPDSTLATKGEICHGGKRSKERLTVLFCTNSDGSEKLKPFVIDFANIDDDLAVFGKNEDPEIITETQDVSDEEREESSNCVVRPSWKEVVDAVDVLERVFITSEDGIENLKILRQVEQAAMRAWG